MYLADTGLLSARMGLRPAMLFNEEELRVFDGGALAENYVSQALVANGFNLM